MRRNTQFALLCLALLSLFACAKTSPSTSPIPSQRPSRAWLTVQENGRVFAWREITGELSQEIFEPAPLPEAPDAKEFSTAFLAETSVSADGVTVVRRVGEPFAQPFRKALNALLREKRYPTLSRREFERALERDQLTCHAGFTAAYFDEKGARIDGEYGCVGELDCADNVLFSVTPPEDQDKITASISLLGVNSKGEEAMACVPGEEWQENAAQYDFPDPADSGPWLVTWKELLPILQGITSPEDTNERQKGICPGNISPSAVSDMRLVILASRALNEFSRELGGMNVFLDRVAGNDSSPSLWDDPCLPQAIELFLADQKIALIPDEALVEACSQSRLAMSPDSE